MSSSLESEPLILHDVEHPADLEANGQHATKTVNEKPLAKRFLEWLSDVMDQPTSLNIQRSLYSKIFGAIPVESNEFLAQLKCIQFDFSISSSLRTFIWRSLLGLLSGNISWQDLLQAMPFPFSVQELARFVADDGARLLEAYPDVVYDILNSEDTQPVDNNSGSCPRLHAILFWKAILRLPFVFDEIARELSPEAADKFGWSPQVILEAALIASWCLFRMLFKKRINVTENRLAD